MSVQSLHFLFPLAHTRSFSSIWLPAPHTIRFPPLGLPRASASAHFSSSDITPSPEILSSDNGIVGVAIAAAAPSIDVDAVTEAELKENGFRSTRRTKLVCTIGPATCGAEQLSAVAVGGMNVARAARTIGTDRSSVWFVGLTRRRGSPSPS